MKGPAISLTLHVLNFFTKTIHDDDKTRRRKKVKRMKILVGNSRSPVVGVLK